MEFRVEQRDEGSVLCVILPQVKEKKPSLPLLRIRSARKEDEEEGGEEPQVQVFGETAQKIVA